MPVSMQLKAEDENGQPVNLKVPLPVTNGDVPILVEAGTVATTDMAYEDGLLVSYVEGGVTWTVARDGDGNITSITPAG